MKFRKKEEPEEIEELEKPKKRVKKEEEFEWDKKRIAKALIIGFIIVLVAFEA